MKIGIEINGVLRDTVGKFKMCYEKFLMPNEYNLEENNDFEYSIIEPIDTIDLSNHFKFKDKDEMFTFMYEECPMEIFGHAMSSEMSTFIFLNEFIQKFKDIHEIYIISDEVGKTKPASLFFLSKFSCLIENIQFYNSNKKEDILSKFDLVVTSNPDVVINYKDKFSIVKFETNYNKNCEGDFNIKSLSELKEIIENLKDA
jgi:hypothetical protein